MKTDEIIAALRYCQLSQHTDCWGCPANIGDSGCLDALHKDAADMLEAQQKRIKELETGRRWIPVTERLPDVHKPMLVCREKKPGVLIVEQGCKDLGVWWRVYGTRVKRIRFWMPLPEPPEES